MIFICRSLTRLNLYRKVLKILNDKNNKRKNERNKEKIKNQRKKRRIKRKRKTSEKSRKKLKRKIVKIRYQKEKEQKMCQK